MDVSFATAKMEKIFNAERLLKKVYGESARAIMRRMVVLKAATCLADVPSVPPEKCHPLQGNREGQFAVYLRHPFRLVFCPDGESVPLKEDGGIDLSKVCAVKIISVEDYH